MRRAIPFLFVLFLSPTAFSQSIQFGVKGGIPLSRYFRTAGRADQHTSYSSLANRYTVGPTIEVRLTERIGVEFDVLYKHFQFEKFAYSATGGPSSPIDTQVRTKTTTDSWEVPLLLKYHTPGLPVGTFIEVGPFFQGLGQIRQTRTTRRFDSGVPLEVTRTNTPDDLGYWRTNSGFVFGGGIELRMKSLKLSPGARTTMWRHKSLYSTTAASYDGLLGFEQNQVEFLMGITF
jgi:Outer membrane protein beta-barrel domain